MEVTVYDSAVIKHTFIWSSQQSWDMDINTPHLYMKKVKLRDLVSLTQRAKL